MEGPNAMRNRIWEMYVFGTALLPEKWCIMAKNPEWKRMFRGLIWKNGNQQFILAEDNLLSPEGNRTLRNEPLTIIHPVEMDAKDILSWERFIATQGIKPYFPQLGEPIVLKNGKLPGALRKVESMGKTYEMSKRYKGFRFPLSMTVPRFGEEYHFIIRKKWKGHTCLDEIERVHIVTPAGIFYNCCPSCPMKTIRTAKNLFLTMNLFWPFQNIRIRTLNHVAATLERGMTEQFVLQDRLDLLLPHLRTFSVHEVEHFKSMVNGTRTAAFLEDIISEREKTC